MYSNVFRSCQSGRVTPYLRRSLARSPGGSKGRRRVVHTLPSLRARVPASPSGKRSRVVTKGLPPSNGTRFRPPRTKTPRSGSARCGPVVYRLRGAESRRIVDLDSPPAIPPPTDAPLSAPPGVFVGDVRSAGVPVTPEGLTRGGCEFEGS